MIAVEISKKRKILIKKLNDMHIFIYQAISLLLDYKNNYQKSKGSLNKYYVPSLKKKSFTLRSDKDLKETYDQFINRSLYENFIVTSVSQFEAFLVYVLKLIILNYPHKLSISAKNTDSNKKVDLDIILESSDKEEIISRMINERVNQISYLPPNDYLQYFKNVTGINISKKEFHNYVEIKATRDLLIHNSGIINHIYLSKVGKSKRGAEGETIVIGSDYYDHTVATLKELARIIGSEVNEIYKRKK